MSNHVHGLTLAAAGVLVLSPDTLLIRLIDSDRWVILFWRGLLVAITLGVYFIIRYRHDAFARVRAIGGPGLFAALFFACNSILFVTSITLTKVANTLVIISAAPLFAAIASFLFLRERVPGRTWLAVVAGFLGIGTIFSGSLGTGDLLGDLCALGTAWFFAAHLTVVRHARRINMAPTIAISGLLVASVGLLATPSPGPWAVNLGDFLLLLLLGALILPVSFSLIVRAPRYLPAAEVSLIMLAEAILGPLWVWLVIKEMPNAPTFIGGAIVLGTLILHEVLSLKTVPDGGGK